tara:strand:- start:1416 stop:1646 length:231 start_codon:yes stop_codon:yes gene_type:complete
MNINENLMIERLEAQGDALAEFNDQAEMDAIRDMMADESEMDEAAAEDWYAQLLDESLKREEIEVWSDFWNDKETL